MTTSSITPVVNSAPITIGQIKQVNRFAEDAIEKAFDDLYLDKTKVQCLIERGGNFQKGIAELIARLVYKDFPVLEPLGPDQTLISVKRGPIPLRVVLSENFKQVSCFFHDRTNWRHLCNPEELPSESDEVFFLRQPKESAVLDKAIKTARENGWRPASLVEGLAYDAKNPAAKLASPIYLLGSYSVDGLSDGFRIVPVLSQNGLEHVVLDLTQPIPTDVRVLFIGLPKPEYENIVAKVEPVVEVKPKPVAKSGTEQQGFVIDCDAKLEDRPEYGMIVAPDTEQVNSRIRGQFVWDATKVDYILVKAQENGWINGDKLKKALEGKAVLTAHILEFLMKHPELIPDSLKGKYLMFWGTIYRGRDGYLYVRYLYWHGSRWDWYCICLGSEFYSNVPAALVSSAS